MKQHLNCKNDTFNRPFSFLGCLSISVSAFAKYVTKNSNDTCRSFLIFIIFFLPLLILPAFSFSQNIEVINRGLPIKNTNHSVIIYGNVTHDLNGNIANDGDFYIKGNWINNNLSDKIFTSGFNGWVHLDSAAQNIGGITTTHFNNLDLAGTGIKKLSGGLGVDAEIEDTLALNNHEFDAGDNTVFVMSTDTAVITRTNGFVSSTNDGGLARNTASTNHYFYPVGSSLITPLFRPVEILPNSPLANTFKVRMANNNPDADMFTRTLKEDIVGDINPKFYHKINRTAGIDKADITIYYDNIVDNDFVYDIIADWKQEPSPSLTGQWKNPGMGIPGLGGYGLNKRLTTKAFSGFFLSDSLIPFALAVNVEPISGGVFVPNVFSPNGDGINDMIFARGKGIIELSFVIYDRWGEKVFETNDPNAGWDGTFRGEPLNLAVFVYIIKAKFKNGDIVDKKGNFTLLR